MPDRQCYSTDTRATDFADLACQRVRNPLNMKMVASRAFTVPLHAAHAHCLRPAMSHVNLSVPRSLKPLSKTGAMHGQFLCRSRTRDVLMDFKTRHVRHHLEQTPDRRPITCRPGKPRSVIGVTRRPGHRRASRTSSCRICRASFSNATATWCQPDILQHRRASSRRTLERNPVFRMSGPVIVGVSGQWMPYGNDRDRTQHSETHSGGDIQNVGVELIGSFWCKRSPNEVQEQLGSKDRGGA